MDEKYHSTCLSLYNNAELVIDSSSSSSNMLPLPSLLSTSKSSSYHNSVINFLNNFFLKKRAPVLSLDLRLVYKYYRNIFDQFGYVVILIPIL